MDHPYPIIEEPATPEYILSILQDMHRQQCQYDPEACEEELTFETTIAHYCAVRYCYRWPKLGRAFNQIFGIRCSDTEWRTVLEPAKQKTLRDVCNLLARYVHRLEIRPARLFGKTCKSAGTFLTVRTLLGQAGAEVEEIAPSTLLAPYTRRYYELFLGPISRLAPGALPPVRIRERFHEVGCWLILAGTGCMGIAAMRESLLMVLLGIMFFVILYALAWIAALTLPRSVEFGTLRTFRDLSLVLSQEKPAEIETNENK